MAAHHFFKSTVEKMEHLFKGAVNKLNHVVKCAVKAQDYVVKNDVKKQVLLIEGAEKERDHAVNGAVKRQVRFIEAAVEEKKHAVQGTVKVHDYSVKEAAEKPAHMVEVAVMKQDCAAKDAVKSVDEDDFYESLADFRRKYSAEAVASRHYKRPGLLTIMEEDETRDGEPIHNFLAIFQTNKYGKPKTLSWLDPPAPLSPISSIASAAPPEPCLLSKCCSRIGKNARRNKRKVKRASKRLVERMHLQSQHIRSSSLWGCAQKCSHPPRASPYGAAHPSSHQSVMSLPIATLSSFQLPPLEF
ncbi:MAG: hypothetical protein SEPTF4163_006607 [Sporothrix epigloea]